MCLSAPSFHREEEVIEVRVYTWTVVKGEASVIRSLISGNLDFYISLTGE